MKPGAIQNAVVEVVQEILKASQPAGEIINAYVRARRYIGSKDRRALTDLVWWFVRHKKRLDYLFPKASVETKLTKRECVPEMIPDAPFDVNMEVPEWLVPLIPDAETELPALLESAPIVLRANGHREQIRKALAKEGILTHPTTLSAYGLILEKRVNLNVSASYRTGLVEVQDEGSQCVALETEIHAGDSVLDYCAGAGGKSLIFAQMMGNTGEIVAHDKSEISLKELKRRAERAGAHCIRVEKPIRSCDFNHVVADVPCSGTGTWRRCPDARWKLTQRQLEALVKTQAEILDEAVRFVCKGGRLSYMTCSLTHLENEAQAEGFLLRHPDFRIIKQKRFSPAKTGTDGLFVAVFQRETE